MGVLDRLPLEVYARDAFDGFAPGGFGLATARATAWLAQLAYEDQADKIDLILGFWGLRRVARFDRPARTPLPLPCTRGFLATGHGACFLAFQGTDPMVVAHWVTNFSFRLNQDGIHRGFDAAVQAAWPEIAAALGKAGPSLPLVVCGHSLGGALAVLSALRARRELGMTVLGVYTLGMPRIGGVAFASDYDQVLGGQTYRLIYGEDLIPTVPPASFKFRHVGRRLSCARQGRFDPALLSPLGDDEPPFAAGVVTRTRIGLQQILSGSFPAAARPDFLGRASRFFPIGIADHLPDRYWRALAPATASAEAALL